MRTILAFLILSSAAFGQGVSFQTPPIMSQVPQPIAGLNGAVCLATSTGTPCTPTVSVFSDSALSVPITSLKTDGDGLFPTFFISPGQYQWCASDTLGRISAYCTKFTAPAAAGSSPSFVNLTVTNTATIATAAVTGNETVGGTLGAGGLTSAPFIGPSPWVDVMSSTYGCKGDGATDDSVCLQAAFTAAINAHTCAFLPPKTFKFATTLNINVGVQGLCLRGNGMQPNISGASILLYTGATTALSGTDGTVFSFGYDWDGIVIEAGANATNAVLLNNPSEFRFKRVGIWSDGVHKFTNGWNCSGCNIGTWEQWIVSNATNAVVLTSTAQSPSASLDFISADTFQVTNVFTLSGQANNITDIAGWHETQNTVMLIDDTSTATSVTAIYFGNTRMLFNGALATYPDSLLMKVNNVVGNVMTIHQINFDHVAYSTNQAVPYPISITEGNASSIVWLGIGGNSSFQGATTGLINTSLAGGTAGLRLNLYGMESVNSSLATLTPNVAGTGALFSDLEFGALTSSGSATFNLAGSFVAVGANPSQTGAIRLANNLAVAGRNLANNADFNLIYPGTDNNVHLGKTTAIDTGGLQLSASGFLNMVETTTPGGVGGNDVCYPDSTLHALKCNYNNVGYFQMAQVITATSAAFATATTAGTCVQNTTAVTGATTAMTVQVSPVSTPGVGAQWSAFVSSAGNITINECAVAASAGGSIAFNIRVTP